MVVDDAGKGIVAEGNRAEKNRLKSNDVDLFLQTQGKGNIFQDNDCATSVPAGLCG